MDTSSNNVKTQIMYNFTPYWLIKLSGVLGFWDDPEEDIYDFNDGEEIDGNQFPY